MEPIIVYLRRKLKEAGSSRWAAIAATANESIEDAKNHLTFHSLRKIAYGERPNLGLLGGQALLDFFQAVERGERELPADEKAGA